MTKKDFFIIVIKVFGLYAFITTLFSALPHNIFYIIMPKYANTNLIDIVFLIGIIITICGLIYLLLAKAHHISSILKLEKGFDDDKIDFGSLNSLDIIKFSILIIGGLLFIKNIPIFLNHAFFAFKFSAGNEFHNQTMLKYNKHRDYIDWAISGANLVVGYLLIFNFKKISNYLNKKVAE